MDASIRAAEIIGQAIRDALRYGPVSPNEADRNFEPAGIPDGLYFIARSIGELAEAVNRLAPPALLPVPPPTPQRIDFPDIDARMVSGGRFILGPEPSTGEREQ